MHISSPNHSIFFSEVSDNELDLFQINSDEEMDFFMDLEEHNRDDTLEEGLLCVDPTFDDFDIHTDDSDANEDDMDPTQVSTSESDTEEAEDDASSSAVLRKIEHLALLFLKQLALPGRSEDVSSLSSQSEDSAELSKKAHFKITIPLADRRKSVVDGTGRKILRFPKKSTTGSAKCFAQLFKVLDLAHEAIISGVPVTKRDIYYRDVSLFKKQKVVDTLVDDIAASFDFERSDLNIRASSKGLICGSGLTITLLSGEIIHCNDTEGSLIPSGEDVETFSVCDSVSWVLVIEKEAVFQTLCRLQICTHKSMPGAGIMITGKGYPDVVTRHMVRSLSDALPPRIPIMALVDGDPYGLDILSVYKYGSQSMQHESSKLAADRIRWLGIRTSELEGLGVEKDTLLPISVYDEKKAYSLLRDRRSPLPRRWRKELQYMLHSRRKAEIEILSTRSGDVGDNNREQDPSSNEKDSPPHSLLIRYLASKISACVASAASH